MNRWLSLGHVRRYRSVRPVAGATLVAVALFLGLGHGLHPGVPEMDAHGATELASVCLVLFTVLGSTAALTLVRFRRATCAPAFVRSSACSHTAPMRPAARARASPALLQRFLH